MGTVFTIDVRDPGDWTGAIADVVGWLHRVDRVFSTYRPDSDVSRLQRREIRLAEADPLVAEVLERCAELEAASGGHFSARRGGRIDPTGLVKGWARQRAGGCATAARPTMRSTAAATSSWPAGRSRVACGRSG
jgi:thiamine biosynthesis lipoprotein